MIDLSKITKDGKALFLAYDQGMEHGPLDFDDDNADPEYILDIGLKGMFTGVIFQKGIAEKYYKEEYKDRLPLIIKLNGKTNLIDDPDPYSPQICSVKEAIEIGASAVGYTIYVGSSHEAEMFKEFANIEQEAHASGIPVVGWMYLKGSGVEGKDIRDLTAYAARLGLEMGADIIKIKHPGTDEALRWAIENAGKTKVVVSGGTKENEEEFINMVQSSMDSGATGMAVGRNIWQADKPLDVAEKIQKIIWTQD